MVKKSEFHDWLRDPVTRKLFEVARDSIDRQKNNALRLSDSVDKVVLNTAYSKGYVDGLMLVLSIELFDQEDQKEDVIGRRDYP